MYTTIAKVRELSGFDDTTNIPDSVVRGKIITASGMFDSAISQRYSLPLLKHRSNTLTFGGEGTGSGTMTIVINGTNYEINISNGLTAAQAADLFRVEAIGSEDFVADDFYGEALVTIRSKDCTGDFETSNAQVDVTSAPDTQGITVSIGTRIDNYSPMIEQTVAEIAAALLLFDNYGFESADTNKDGSSRLAGVNETLQKLQGVHESGMTIDLYDDICQVQYSSSTQSLPSYLPNSTTNDDPNDPTSAKFGINDQF